MSTFVDVKWTKTQLEKRLHCGQLIFGEIIKFDATRCQILRLECTEFDFRWGFAPDPTGGAYSASTEPLAVFNGTYL